MTAQRTSSLIILSLIIAAISAYLGYAYGAQKANIKTPTGTYAGPQLKIGPSSIIQNQQATAIGIITSVQKGLVTVKADNSDTTILKLAPNFADYVPVATASA